MFWRTDLSFWGRLPLAALLWRRPIRNERLLEITFEKVRAHPEWTGPASLTNNMLFFIPPSSLTGIKKQPALFIKILQCTESLHLFPLAYQGLHALACTMMYLKPHPGIVWMIFMTKPKNIFEKTLKVICSFGNDAMDQNNLVILMWLFYKNSTCMTLISKNQGKPRKKSNR